MGYSASAYLVCGVPLSEVKKVTVSEVMEPRFDSKTGKPKAPEKVITKTVTFLGRPVETDGGPEDWLCALKEKVLECVSQDCEGDESKQLIGVAVGASSDGNSRKINTIEMLTKFDDAQKKYGLDLRPSFYLVLSESY